MLKKLFGFDKKGKSAVNMPEATGKDVLMSPITGDIVSLSEVPDPTFSQKMLGDGVAVKPKGTTVVAPTYGEIIQVFPTKHALGLKTVNGIELLIHIGLETVSMKGEGFQAFVKEGDKVAQGDKLIEFDIRLIEEKATSTITPIIITNVDAVESLVKEKNISAVAGETAIMTVVTK
ncbi:PTS glucose transporter subunit IIA [Evansella sp. AB-rgal1]|uniref:PTS sugar transporter subunit IIA n=1 Tax=Evansella sp. AB-rgal1 TaxID=3242696 RepID=UPI00359E408D